MAQERQYKWLVLIYSLPPEAGSSRVKVWRKLKKLGAASFRNSVYLLPFGEERYEIAQWLCQEIQRAEGEATLLKVEQIENLSDEEVATLFQRARNEDYRELTKEGRAWLEHLEGLPQKKASQEAGVLADGLKALEKRLAELEEIDYFHATGRREVEAILKRCRATLRELFGREESRALEEARTLKMEEFRGKTWATRPRPHVDRIATAWAIRRFIDPKAKFAFVRESEKIKEGIPFDYLGVEFGHQGEDCTFETVLKRFGLKGKDLQAVAEIVHDADLKDAKFGREEAKGVDAVIKGLAAIIADDHALLAQGLLVFDALYASFGGGGASGHGSQARRRRKRIPSH
ncbi:MAG: chromate resistance protein [candidate division NC10 bacterium]|nr:chromate resistance protein [candidate division NC10 bacterium]